MKALSMDLRERIVRAVGQGQPHTEVARRFGICVNTVKRLLKLQQQTGALAHRRCPGGARKIPREQESLLQARLETAPDATMREQGQWWAEQTGQAVSETTMWRAVHRLGWTHKKRRWQRASAMKPPARRGGRR